MHAAAVCVAIGLGLGLWADDSPMPRKATALGNGVTESGPG
jgi:hypothetical protein